MSFRNALVTEKIDNCEIMPETATLRREASFTKPDDMEKNIGYFGSFCLLANNISGPGMMGLPRLFVNAGIIPSSIAILVVASISGFGGTILSDSISSIPGNSMFERQIEFSSAFQVLGGDHWYLLAESFFVISCLIQACSGLVETSQSIDSFIAGFIWGETYAFQLYPTVEVITWNSDACSFSSSTSLCTPFYTNGPLIISLG